MSEFVTIGNKFDFDGFKKAVDTAVIALNEALDEGLPLHPLEEQQESVRNWRQIGLGIFGLADMFIKLGVRYGSSESIELSEQIGSLLANQAIRMSARLAQEGGAYPKYKETRYKTLPSTSRIRMMIRENSSRHTAYATRSC